MAPHRERSLFSSEGTREVKGATFVISFGEYGGFYCNSGRLCLGWVAFTFLPFDIDDVLGMLLEDKR